MIQAIKGVLGGLFGTEKAIDNILDKDSGLLRRFGGWVDDFNYTPEERAAAEADKREWGIRQLDALAPFKVVQRILAFSATALWGFVGINIVLAFWVESMHPEINISKPLLEFALSNYVLYPTLACYSLYFGGGVIESLGRTKK